jgi:hypothetical protein
MSDAIQSTCGESAPAANLDRSYDLILIGSGMGALTIASR